MACVVRRQARRDPQRHHGADAGGCAAGRAGPRAGVCDAARKSGGPRRRAADYRGDSRTLLGGLPQGARRVKWRLPWSPGVSTALLAALILGLNLWLNAPLFMSGELPFRGSVEGGYVGMARFIAQHPSVW